MELDNVTRPVGQAQPLSDEDRRFLRELVETNRIEHHGRLSYMDIMFDLEHRYGNSLPGPVLGEVARLVGTSPAQLNGFVTFYTMLSTAPRGKHVVRVCTSGPCHVSGAPAILSSLRQLLGVGIGETTPDGEFTLEGSSCLGICGVSPALMIDDDAYGNLTPEDLPRILDTKRAGGAQ
ncbi:MAG: NAD(P)H-dependent oxidoreductase subunit E [Caldiserica bacterium]|nr:NAD(P)H-dependent oxidoreductase subunit E [Caldisericota bacterium]